MSLKSALLQAARLARSPLGETAGQVLRFLRGQAAPDGLFCDRAGKPDLYYTVFGLMGLDALGSPAAESSLLAPLTAAGRGETLDFVHLSCLARCWSLARPSGPPADVRAAVLARLATFRTPDGGYAPETGAAGGTMYGCFLALGAIQDLGADVPDADGLARCLDGLATGDGGYANEPGVPMAAVPAAAAAVTILAELGRPVPPQTIDWLRGCTAPGGGFLVAPVVPVPDLLSTATALHALGRAGAALDGPARAACLGFVFDLLGDDSGFRGHLADDAADCEYTFYGLLALGHLL